MFRDYQQYFKQISKEKLLEIENFLTQEESEYLVKVILDKEQEVLNIPNPLKSAYTGLTRQYSVFNWLNTKEFQAIDWEHKFTRLIPDLLCIQCWANVLRKNESLGWHRHSLIESFLVGNIFLAGAQNTTEYEVGLIENKVGTLVLTTSKMNHAVPVNKYEQPRISLAFDIHNEEFYDPNRWVIYEKRRTDSVN